jgi:hypothetical protein
MGTKGQTVLLQLICGLLAGLLITGCVGKRPDDEVALIKQTLGAFERGVNQRSETILDSIMLDKKERMSARLLDSLIAGKKLQGGRIAKKSFTVVKDSAEVRLRLSLEYVTATGGAEKVEKPLDLFMRKRRGKWKVESFNSTPPERQEEKE